MIILTMSLGYYNRNPCKDNTLPTVVVDDLSPWKMKASKSIVEKFIHVIGRPIANLEGVVP